MTNPEKQSQTPELLATTKVTRLDSPPPELQKLPVAETAVASQAGVFDGASFVS